MERKSRVAVAGGMHTEVETGMGADANIDFFIVGLPRGCRAALSCVRELLRALRGCRPTPFDRRAPVMA